MNFDSANKKIDKTLDHLSKFFGLDMHYIAKNGFWLLLAQGIISLSAFATTIVLTRILSPEVFGRYRFVLSLLPLLAIFTLPGMAPALTRAVARGAKPNLWRIALVKIKFGILSTFATLLVALYYKSQSNETLFYIFIGAAFFLPFYEVFLIYSPYLKGKFNFKTPAIYEATSRVIQAVALIITALLTHSAFALIIAFLIAQITTQFIAFIKTYFNNLPDSKTAPEAEDDVEQYGKKLFLVNIAGHILEPIDKLLVWHFFGAKTLALYIVVMTIPLTITRALSPLLQLIFPKISRIYIFTRKNFITYINKQALMLVAMILLALVIYILSTSLYDTLFPNYTHITDTTLLIAMLIIPLYPLVASTRDLLIGHKKISAQISSYTIEFFVQILFFVTLMNTTTMSPVNVAIIALIFGRIINFLFMNTYIISLVIKKYENHID